METLSPPHWLQLDPPLVRPDVTIQAALATLRHSGYVLVRSALSWQAGDLSGSDLCGLLTQQDVIGLLADSLDPWTTTVGSVVAEDSFSPYQTSTSPDPRRILLWMQQHQVRYLPIVDELDQLLGVAVWEDLLSWQQMGLENQTAVYFRDSLEAAIPQGIARVNLGGQQTYVNQRFAEIVGWSQQELMAGKFPYLCCPPEERERMAQILAQMSEGNDQQHWHTVFMRRNGEKFPVRLQSAPLKDDHGQMIGHTISIQEISAERQIIQQLAQQQSDLKAFFRQSLDGIFFMMLDEPIDWQQDMDQEALLDYVFDHQRVTRANPAILEQYGLTEDEFIGFRPRDFFAHNLSYGRELWRNLFNKGQLHTETDERRSDGSQVWFDGDYICLYDQHGRITGHFGIQRDITQDKITRLALQRSEERLRLATELTETGSWEFDIETGQAVWSDSHYRLMGVQPGAVDPCYTAWRDRVHAEDVDGVEAAFAEALKDRSLLSVEYRVVYPDGAIHWVMTKGQGVYDPDGQPLRMVGVMFDITARKRSENLLRSMIGAIPDLILQMASDGTPMQFLSAGQVRSPNPTRDHRPGIHLSEILPPEVVAQRLHYIHRALHTQSLQIYEQQLEINGQQQHEEVRVVPCDQDSVLCVIRDISDRKQNEQSLRRRLQIEQLLNQITQGIQQSLPIEVILNRALETLQSWIESDRVIVYRLQADLSGIIIAEAVSDVQYSILHEQITDPCFANQWHQRFQQGHISQIDDVALAQIQPCHADLLIRLQVQANLVVPIHQGEQLWGLLIAHQCRSPRHWQPWIVDTMNQLTQHLAVALQQADLVQKLKLTNDELTYQVEVRNAELQRLVDYEQLLRIIIESIRASLNQDEIFATTTQELTLGLNLGACYIALFDPESHRYRIQHQYRGYLSASEISTYQPDPQILTELQKQLTVHYSTNHCLYGWCTIVACPIALQAEGFIGYLKLLRPRQVGFSRGEIRLAEQVASQCAIGIQQARLHEVLQQQVEQLMAMNQLKEEFLNMVSHELRTPLASMRMALRMLDTTEVSERQRRYLDILHQEYGRELNLVDNLLDLQRMEAGRQDLNPEAIDLPSWIQDILNSFQLRCQDRHLTLVADLPPGPRVIRTDPHLLRRILSELLNNACKYTPPQEQIIVRLCPQPAPIQIQVINTGVEIPTAELPRVFDKFHRVPSLDRYRQGGSGLGLPLIKKAIELLGGTVEVTSKQGSTCFTVNLESVTDRAFSLGSRGKSPERLPRLDN